MDKSILFKELCEQYDYYNKGISAQRSIDESPNWYFDKRTQVIKLTMHLGLLKELCEEFPEDVAIIVEDMLLTTNWDN